MNACDLVYTLLQLSYNLFSQYVNYCKYLKNKMNKNAYFYKKNKLCINALCCTCLEFYHNFVLAQIKRNNTLGFFFSHLYKIV